jgi:hypothetical protein
MRQCEPGRQRGTTAIVCLPKKSFKESEWLTNAHTRRKKLTDMKDLVDFVLKRNSDDSHVDD